MADMFGAPIGVEHGIQSARGLAELAIAPAQLRLTEAKASLEEEKAASQKRFAATAIDPKAGMWGVAAAAFQAGMPDAYKYANAASQIDYRSAAGDTQRLRQAEIGIKIQASQLDNAARLLSAARDDASFQSALQDFERSTGSKTGLLDPNGELTQPYSPELVGRIRGMALSTKDAMLLDFRNKSLESANRERASKQKSRDFWQNMDHQYERESARQRARVESHGPASLFPSNAQIGIGADFLADKFGVENKDPWTRVMGRELIDQAKRLRASNPALSSAESIEQAFKELDKRGSFGAHRLVNKAEDKLRPMTLPYGEDGKPSFDKLVPGQLYRDDSGQIREWTGKGWSTSSQRIRGAGEPAYSLTESDARTALGLDGAEDEEPSSSSDDDDEED